MKQDKFAKFPNGLAAAMKRVDIGVTALARAVGTSKQNVSRHMKGERRLYEEWAERYAPHLDVRPEELLFAAPMTKQPNSRLLYVPVLSWVSAGRLAHQDGVSPGNITKTILVADLPAGDWIALQVDGDSMDRIAPDGSIILVDRSDDRLISNKFYVFSTDHGEATFKQYRSRPDRLHPFSTNPDHETFYPEHGMKVIGRVRKVITEL